MTFILPLQMKAFSTQGIKFMNVCSPSSPRVLYKVLATVFCALFSLQNYQVPDKYGAFFEFINLFL